MKFFNVIFGRDRALIRKIAQDAREIADAHTLAVARLNRILDEREAEQRLNRRLVRQRSDEVRILNHKARVLRHPWG